MTYDTPATTVRLRPITLEDCAIEEANAPTPETEPYSYYGFINPGRARKAVESGESFPKFGELNGRLSVEADGEYIGNVSWHPVHYGPVTAPALNFGISLIPSGRGKGHGSEAQRQLIEYLFDTTTVNRVEASTDVENLAEQRALEKAGLVREGVCRGCHFRAGEYRDMVVFATVRADFYAARKTVTSKVRTGFTA
ncbi:GCN5-related N-acetyltransferase [Catenulispora acidiphila DSM 44928]|uniref:GCN5-related N-acetyltransferase n=1 Tax=Catenulispora acidiphila (strain DSM 44928 / JCM 14897 / NBRC 102108 / NRRL B-24433 / ID139908) TaxID=479433 RepID=C7Q8N5_CATAD|nr:GNAT family protein [Catenulispora acidiphila]ACU70300.1 GCN5-related N-acetyltransferase [Catenulispora acidiphila DSM 44928]